MRYFLCMALLACGCHVVGVDFTDAGYDGGQDTETGTETETETADTDTGTEEIDAVAECEAGIEAWYEGGCYLTCDPNGVPVDCSWSPTGSTPLTIEQSQTFCTSWASPACLEHLEAMLDCWADNFDSGALCPAVCLVDGGDQDVLLLLEECT